MNTQDILLTLLGGGNIILFVKFLIERHDRKQERDEDNFKESFRKWLERVEKDVLRTQLLLMIIDMPDEKKEIMTLGQHYFVDLKGNWYMTDIFNKWLLKEGHSRPEWFDTDD